ncbi:MAG: ATPase [Desulfobacterales bacterium]
MVSIDYTLIIQIINFVVLIWALNLVLYRPIRGIINQRTEKVEGLETGIERFEQDVVDKDQAIKDGLKEARAKGVQEKETLENEAKELEKQKIEEINERARQDLAKVREQIARDMESARQSLEAEVDKFADDISQKILGRAV